ncbi:arrestin domain-containing protein 3-like [Oncorhynchus masou masou]|uniref:arrestin domain-containing protein 3-like n=1 Tax=Oncorhynchus masou masou TaxID=90313 RepID=UPI00318332B6
MFNDDIANIVGVGLLIVPAFCKYRPPPLLCYIKDRCEPYQHLFFFLCWLRFILWTRMTIQIFTIKYDAENGPYVFSRGDTITGRIILVVSAETKIKCLSIKAKGKAHILWEEDYGLYLDETYHVPNMNIFSIEYFMLGETTWSTLFSVSKFYFHFPILSGTTVLTTGRHVYPFSFQIPDEDMPSSFQGKCGQILYSLEAKLTRSMRFDTKAKTDFPFVSKADRSMIPYLMVRNSIWLYCHYYSTSHSAAYILDLNQHIHIHPHSGEALNVRAIIVSNSTCPVTPKYYLYEKQCFYAQKKRKVHTHNILKKKGDRVPAGTRQTVTQVLTIPPQLPATIFNCPILKLEYRF